MRPDRTDNLIHFIRGETDEDVYGTLRQILHEQRILRGGGCIKGGYRCICFGELSLGNPPRRPSTVAGADHDQLSTAFFQNVNKVLTDDESAQEAVSQVENVAKRIVR